MGLAACPKEKQVWAFFAWMFVFGERISLCSLDCPQTWNPPASPPKAQESQTNSSRTVRQSLQGSGGKAVCMSNVNNVIDAWNWTGESEVKELESTWQGVESAEPQIQAHSHTSSRTIHCVLASIVFSWISYAKPETLPTPLISTFHNFSTNLSILCEHPN